MHSYQENFFCLPYFILQSLLVLIGILIYQSFLYSSDVIFYSTHSKNKFDTQIMLQ